MKNLFINIYNRNLLFCLTLVLTFVLAVGAQSADPEYPTPVTTNEIGGTIKSRDIGDARLTTFYYVFNGNQGDIFINVESRNLNGDIDIFSAEGLRPLSKIRLYADSEQSETGRIVYLRQPDKLILRVEGRTPDDNPASFHIKFAGSFVAYQGATETIEPAIPKVESAAQGSVRVNSVGTIIAENKEKNADDRERIAEKPPTEQPIQSSETAAETAPKTGVTDEKPIVNDETATTAEPEKRETKKSKTSAVKNKRPVKNKPIEPAIPEKDENAEKMAADPLANVRLIVLMKDGARIEYPMTEVFRFSLNNNVLTIILKDGKIERRSILDIQKFSVE